MNQVQNLRKIILILSAAKLLQRRRLMKRIQVLEASVQLMAREIDSGKDTPPLGVTHDDSPSLHFLAPKGIETVPSLTVAELQQQHLDATFSALVPMGVRKKAVVCLLKQRLDKLFGDELVPFVSDSTPFQLIEEVCASPMGEVPHLRHAAHACVVLFVHALRHYGMVHCFVISPPHYVTLQRFMPAYTFT